MLFGFYTEFGTESDLVSETTSSSNLSKKTALAFTGDIYLGRNEPNSTTCLPLINAENRHNRLEITTIAMLGNDAKSGLFRILLKTASGVRINSIPVRVTKT